MAAELNNAVMLIAKTVLIITLSSEPKPISAKGLAARNVVHGFGK
jgi:hypothetical protein